MRIVLLVVLFASFAGLSFGAPTSIGQQAEESTLNFDSDADGWSKTGFTALAGIVTVSGIVGLLSGLPCFGRMLKVQIANTTTSTETTTHVLADPPKTPPKTPPPAPKPSLFLDSLELARDYEAVSANRQFRAGKVLAATLELNAGDRVLDVGCGTGLLAEHIADLVGEEGKVMGLDPLPLRIELAQTTHARANLSFEVGDAYELDHIPTASYDAICLNAVFHWLPEKTKPLRSFSRILSSGGRLGLSLQMGERTCRLKETAAEVFKQLPFRDHLAAKAGSQVSRVSEQQLRDLLAGAGLEVVKIETSESRQTFESAEDAIRYAESSSFGNFLGRLPEHLRSEARAAIKARLEESSKTQPIERLGRRLIAIARRP